MNKEAEEDGTTREGLDRNVGGPTLLSTFMDGRRVLGGSLSDAAAGCLKPEYVIRDLQMHPQASVRHVTSKAQRSRQIALGEWSSNAFPMKNICGICDRERNSSGRIARPQGAEAGH